MKKYICLFLNIITITLYGQTNRYVWLGGGHISPFTNWTMAATNIQDAISVSSSNDIVWVTNGTYSSGGVPMISAGFSVTNRVYINKSIQIKSINGPSNTFIVGRWHNPGITPCGPNAVRCVWVGAIKTALVGFTISNGATMDNINNITGWAGGIYTVNDSTIISNCIIIANHGAARAGGFHGGIFYDCDIISNNSYYGYGGGYNGVLNRCRVIGNQRGGVVYSTLNECEISWNTNWNPGASVSVLYDCKLSYNTGQYGGAAGGGSILYNCLIISNEGTYGGAISSSSSISTNKLYNCKIIANKGFIAGGGIRYSEIYNSTLNNNSVFNQGGAADSSKLYNCLIIANMSQNRAGAVDSSSLYNCTIIGNTALQGGGLHSCNQVWNSIIYFNRSGHVGSDNYSNSVFNYSCTFPDPGVGVGNITNNPELINCGIGYGTNHVFGNYRLDFNSLCINSGTNFSWMTNSVEPSSKDLDEKQRIRNFIVDMGAYEAWSMEKSILLIRAEDSFPK